MISANRNALILSLALIAAALNSFRTEPAYADAAASTFPEPRAAVETLGKVIGTGNVAAFESLFGPGCMDMFDSGDPVADKADGAHVKAMIAEGIAFEDVDESTKVALLGKDEWPFPIPLVRVGDFWRFDSEKGREELANRRVGRNELLTIATLHAFVDAQREYAAVERDRQPQQFARRIASSPGKHDGLYWPAAKGEPESPLGALVAEAASEGYAEPETRPVGMESRAYHGYRFRILTKRGKGSFGGPKSWIDVGGHMTGGFGCVAWPAEYGESGVMTFMVSNWGIVFQKDLGEQTATIAAAMTAYEPDSTWEPTWDPDARNSAEAAAGGPGAGGSN